MHTEHSQSSSRTVPLVDAAAFTIPASEKEELERRAKGSAFTPFTMAQLLDDVLRSQCSVRDLHLVEKMERRSRFLQSAASNFAIPPRSYCLCLVLERV